MEISQETYEHDLFNFNGKQKLRLKVEMKLFMLIECSDMTVNINLPTSATTLWNLNFVRYLALHHGILIFSSFTDFFHQNMKL